MKLGIPSLFEYRTVEQHLKLCSEISFDFFELNLTFPWFQSDCIDTKDLARLKRQYDKELTIHMHDQLNPFDFSPEMREASIKMTQFALGLAKSLEITRITMHLPYGSYSSIKGVKHYAYDICTDKYLSNVLAFRDLCEGIIGCSDILICLENTKGYLEYQKRTVERLLESPGFALTFDIGHNYKAGGEDETFILQHADRLKHFHIHDVTEKGNHYALGDGILDIGRYFHMAENHNCAAVIEVKESSAILKSVDFLHRNGLI